MPAQEAEAGVSTAVATAAPTRRGSGRVTRAGPASAWVFVAWFITLPPVLVRTPVPSILIGLLAMTAGGWAIAGGEKRSSAGARSSPASSAASGAVAATQSGVGNLKDVVTWSALVAATLRYATPLIFGALGGIVSERSGVVNVGLEGMMLTGAFFGIFGADLLDSWFLGLLVGMAAGGVARVRPRRSSRSTCAPTRSSAASRSTSSPLGLTGYIFLDHYGDQGTPDNIPRVPDVSAPRHQGHRRSSATRSARPTS